MKRHVNSVSYKLEVGRTDTVRVRIPVTATQAEALRALKKVSVKIARDGLKRGGA